MSDLLSCAYIHPLSILYLADLALLLPSRCQLMALYEASAHPLQSDQRSASAMLFVFRHSFRLLSTFADLFAVVSLGPGFSTTFSGLSLFPLSTYMIPPPTCSLKVRSRRSDLRPVAQSLLWPRTRVSDFTRSRARRTALSGVSSILLFLLPLVNALPDIIRLSFSPPLSRLAACPRWSNPHDPSSVQEIEKDETRRLVWSSSALAASFSMYRYSVGLDPVEL